MKRLSKTASCVLLALTMLLMAVPLSAFTSAEAYSYTFSTLPVQGDNVCGALTWHFSMAGQEYVEEGASGRGARFYIGNTTAKELVVSTTITDFSVYRIAVQAAMGSNNNTTLSVTLNGVPLITEQALTSTIGTYAAKVDGQKGELVIRMKASVSGKVSYLKAIDIADDPAVNTKINYHGHTYRCNHAGTATDEDYVTAAIANGYTTMGFTDHVMLPWIDYENSVRGQYSTMAQDYLDSIRALQSSYADQIDIVLGYECEWNDMFKAYYSYLKNNNLVDYLILGNHYLEFNPYTNTFNTFTAGEMDSIDYVRSYTESSVTALNSDLFTIFAHPDYFMTYVTFWDDDVAAYARQLCEAAKAHHVALEINEGCFVNEQPTQMGDELRYRYPYSKFWEIAKEVGNTVVIGVDAHDPSAYTPVARQKALDFAAEIGLTVTEDLGITRQTPNPEAPAFTTSVTTATNITSRVYTVKDAVVSGVPVGTTVEALKANFNEHDYITVYDTGSPADPAATVKTGMTISLYDGATLVQTIEVAVTGDVDGDGKMLTQDARKMLRAMIGTDSFYGAQIRAGDFNGNGIIDSGDVRALLQASVL